MMKVKLKLKTSKIITEVIINPYYRCIVIIIIITGVAVRSCQPTDII